jgi:(2Fe-2S) ferredoxin
MATVELAGDAPTKYADLDERKIAEIIDRHLLGGEVVPEYALAIGEEKVS